MPKFHCCADGCSNSQAKKNNLEKYPWMKDVEFKSFPHLTRKPKARAIWIELVKRGGKTNNFKDKFVVNKYTRICTDHFVDGKSTTKYPHPTLFEYNNYKKPKKIRTTVNSTQAVVEPQHANTTLAGASSLTASTSDAQPPPGSSIVLLKDAQIPIMNEVEVMTEGKRGRKSRNDVICTPVVVGHDYSKKQSDASTQTDLTSHNITELEVLQDKLTDKGALLRELIIEKSTSTSQAVRTYYGVENKEVLNGLFDIASTGVEKMKYWRGKGSVTTKAYEKNGWKKPGRCRKLLPYAEFLLTLMQLKLGILGFVLGDMFGVSSTLVSQVFTTWINHLHQTLVPVLMPWQSRHDIDRDMPAKFRTNYPKTRVIIDCTEFYMESPRKPGVQHRTYSQYKSQNTLKALVGISPRGSFTFVSELWSGNVSDKYITRESGLIERLDEGDEVMADRGFQIEDLLLKRKARLVAPPFTRKCTYGKKKRLNVCEIRRTRKVANHRIYVEQAIGNLKRWRFFRGRMPVRRKAIATQAVHVAAALCNLKAALVK